MPAIRLRAVTVDDLATIVRWSRDETFCRANGWDVGRAEDEVGRHWTRLLTSPPPGLTRLGVEADGELVGYVDLADLTEDDAELGFAIGDSTRWGAGLGTAAARAMVEHGFGVLGLQRIRAVVEASNARSLAVLRKLGFVETCRRLGAAGDDVELRLDASA